MPQENPFLYSIPHRLSYKYVLDYLSLNPDDKFLDIGCGMGQLLKLAGEHTSQITGLDNDPDALNFARQTTNAKIVLGSADQLPFPDSSFDKITIILVLEHIEDDIKAIQEIKRIAKNNATVIIEIPCTQGKLTHTKMHNLMHDSGTEKHFREGYTLTEIKTLLENEGFEIKNHQYTCVYLTELFIQFTKYVYSKKNKSYESQSDILNATEGSKLFKIYKFFFPLILTACKLEDILLSRPLKGHELIIKAKKRTYASVATSKIHTIEKSPPRQRQREGDLRFRSSSKETGLKQGAMPPHTSSAPRRNTSCPKYEGMGQAAGCIIATPPD